MTFSFFINFVIISFIAAVSTGWEHHRGPIVAREEPREYAAWYQMPQGAAAYPPTAYERAVAASAAASQYAGYPRPYSRSPDYYPETAVTNNMVPSGRKAAAAGYYIPASNTQDLIPIFSSLSSGNATTLLQYPTINIRQSLLRRYPTSPTPSSTATKTSFQHYGHYPSHPFFITTTTTTTTTTIPPSLTSSSDISSSSSSSEYVGIRERAADLRSLSSLLRKTAVTRSPLLKLSPPQMDKLMDDQINAFVGVVRKLYEWKDWIWWGSLKYLDLAKKRV
uniref:Uncharacterized protein n=1 Tax=Panagrolaimus superbus TaxID=310955 RepID=A0A914XWP3_9BILA